MSDVADNDAFDMTVENLKYCATAYVKNKNGLLSQPKKKGKKNGIQKKQPPARLEKFTSAQVRLAALEKTPHMKLLYSQFMIHCVDHARDAANSAYSRVGLQRLALQISQDRDWSWEERDYEASNYDTSLLEAAVEDLDVEQVREAADECMKLEC